MFHLTSCPASTIPGPLAEAFNLPVFSFTAQAGAASSNWATLPIRRRKKRNIFKNGETNPFYQTSPDNPTPSSATNKQNVIVVFGGTRI